MSSEATVATEPQPDLKFTVSFHRKVQVRQYESAEAFISIQGEVPVANGDGVYLDELTLDSRLKDSFFTAKAHVFAQLGIPYEVIDGVLVELVKDTFQGATEVTSQVTSAPTLSAAPQASASPQQNGPVSGAVASGGSKGGVTITADLGKGRVQLSSPCKKCGGNSFWNNRDKKASGQYSPKAPDYKCADKECGNGVWA